MLLRLAARGLSAVLTRPTPSQRRIIDATSRFNPAPDALSSAEDEDEGDDALGKEKGCRCGRTKCLKQYCQCFRNNVRCTSDCVCEDCHNDGKHEEKRIEAIRKIRMNNPNAFKGTDLEIQDQEVRTPRGSLLKVIRGCRCKRSRCKKKYCECFGAGLLCTTNCVCNDCENGNDAGSIKTVTAIMKGAKAPTVIRAPAKSRKGESEDDDSSDEAADDGEKQPLRPSNKARECASTVSVLPSQKHKQGSSQPQLQASLPAGAARLAQLQRLPSAQDLKQPSSSSSSVGSMMGPGRTDYGTGGTEARKSFRRNDLKVGVPVLTSAAPAAGGDGNGEMKGIVVTPHGSIHLPSRPSPRGGGGVTNRRGENSPLMFWDQRLSRRSASPRWSQHSPAMLGSQDTISSGDGGSGFGIGILRNESSLLDQYSPGGDLKSDLESCRWGSRVMQPESARESERGRTNQSPMIGFPLDSGAGNGPQRRSSNRNSNMGSATGAGQFDGNGTPPVSPGNWLMGSDPTLIDPEGIFAEPNSGRSWAKNLHDV